MLSFLRCRRREPGIVRAQHIENRPHQPFQQVSLWPRARQNPNAEKRTQKRTAQIRRILTVADRAIGLPCLDATSEKRLDLVQNIRDNTLELLVMWRDLKRGIDQKTSLAFRVVQRTVNDLRKKCSDCFVRR